MEAINQLIESGEYYRAHQNAKSLAFRMYKRKNVIQMEEFMIDVILKFMNIGNVRETEQSAIDMCMELIGYIEGYNEADSAGGAKEDMGIFHLWIKIYDAIEEITDQWNEVINKSVTIFYKKANKNQHSEVRTVLAELCFYKWDLPEVSLKHIAYSNSALVICDFYLNYFDKLCSPAEMEMFVVQQMFRLMLRKEVEFVRETFGLIVEKRHSLNVLWPGDRSGPSASQWFNLFEAVCKCVASRDRTLLSRVVYFYAPLLTNQDDGGIEENLKAICAKNFGGAGLENVAGAEGGSRGPTLQGMNVEVDGVGVDASQLNSAISNIFNGGLAGFAGRLFGRGGANTNASNTSNANNNSNNNNSSNQNSGRFNLDLD